MDARSYGYAHQMAFYRSLVAVATGETLPVYLIAVEKREPLRCGVWRMGENVLGTVQKENEEAIESGAFWFYRKLGFRSADPAIETLVRREEEQSTLRPGRRTPPATLRRIAGAPLRLDLPGRTTSAWAAVSLDDVGLRVQRRMAASGLSPDVFREGCERRVGQILKLRLDRKLYTSTGFVTSVRSKRSAADGERLT